MTKLLAALWLLVLLTHNEPQRPPLGAFFLLAAAPHGPDPQLRGPDPDTA